MRDLTNPWSSGERVGDEPVTYGCQFSPRVETDRQQDTNPATTGAKQGDVHGSVPSEESAEIREYFELRDALTEPGCPVCAQVIHAGHGMLAALTDGQSAGGPGWVKAISLRGLCNTHAWILHQMAQKPVGLGKAYEAFLRSRIERLQRAVARQNATTRRPCSGWIRAVVECVRAFLQGMVQIRRCPACRVAKAVERRDLGLLLDLITDMEFARAFEGSTGLCLPHLNLILRVAPDHPNLRRLLEAHLPKMRSLQADLQDYLRRAKAPLPTLTAAEEVSLGGRVLGWTSGEAGVFGPERPLGLVGEGWRIRLSRVWRSTRLGMSAGTGENGCPRERDEVERVQLENAKLRRRLLEISREWAEESARRAALQFQVHKLAEDVKVLELNLAGARGETKSGDIRAKRLRDEVQALQDEVQQLRKKRGESSSSSGGEG